MRARRIVAFCLVLTFAECSVSVKTSTDKTVEQQKPVEQPNRDVIEVTFLQLNDVYEITPVENGKFGGMARVATVRKDLLTENPNTFTVLSGDFISPSAIGTSKYQGKRINGAQMVDAMNSAGVDLVTFGNHEFDLGYEALQDRINQSTFTWVASNILYTPSMEGFVKPFEKMANGKVESFPESYIITAKNSSGMEMRIGVLGLTIGSNTPPYIVWNDPFESARQAVNELKPKTDFIVALTHLSIEEDKKLASLVPDINIILGGHEHTNMMFKIGETIISKADGNARTVFVHRVRWSSSKKSLNIVSELKTIDKSIPDDPATAKVVNDWTTRAYAGFEESGFSPEEIVTTVKEPLDGREISIRFKQTNLGTTVCNGMLAAAKKSKIAIFNSGSIRLDDQLNGVITQYDIIRTMPFGGKIIEAEMKASLLQRVLDAAMKRSGEGGFPQYSGVEYDVASRKLTMGGKVLDGNAKVWVIVSDYLFSGKEQGIEFFKKDNPDVSNVDEPTDANDLRKDIRLAVIAYLKK